MKNENILATICLIKYYIPILKINENNNIEIINELKGPYEHVKNCIEINNGNIVSISFDNKIIEWKLINNNYEIKNIINEKYSLPDIIEIKPNIIVYSCNRILDNYI